MTMHAALYGSTGFQASPAIVLSEEERRALAAASAGWCYDAADVEGMPVARVREVLAGLLARAQESGPARAQGPILDDHSPAAAWDA